MWEPLLLGCFVLGLASAVLGQILIRLVWRAHIMVSWRDRRIRRQRRDDHASPGVPPPAAVNVSGGTQLKALTIRIGLRR